LAYTLASNLLKYRLRRLLTSGMSLSDYSKHSTVCIQLIMLISVY